MKWLLLLALVGCRMPDTMGVPIGATRTDWDIDRSAGQGISGDAVTVGIVPTWFTGEHLARLREDESRAKRMEALQIAHASHAGVVIHTGSEDEEETEDGWSTLTKALTALGGSLAVALTAWLQLRTKKPSMPVEDTEG